MSEAAMLTAAKKWIEDKVGGETGRVEIKLPHLPIPSPSSPDLVLVVTFGPTAQEANEDHYTNEVYTLRVLVHRKTGQFTTDTREQVILKAIDGLAEVSRRTIDALHGNVGFREHANTYLQGGYEFTSNLVAQTKAEPYPRENPYARNSELDTWIVQPLTFVGLRRPFQREVTS